MVLTRCGSSMPGAVRWPSWLWCKRGLQVVRFPSVMEGRKGERSGMEVSMEEDHSHITTRTSWPPNDAHSKQSTDDSLGDHDNHYLQPLMRCELRVASDGFETVSSSDRQGTGLHRHRPHHKPISESKCSQKQTSDDVTFLPVKKPLVFLFLARPTTHHAVPTGPDKPV